MAGKITINKQTFDQLSDIRVIIDEQSLDELGNILWDLRATTPIIQSDMAKKMGSSQSHVSSMESNEVVPQLNSIIKYLGALGYQLEITPKNPANIPS